MKLKILSHQEFAGAILRKPTEEVKFPLSEEDNIILDFYAHPRRRFDNVAGLW